MRRIKVGEYEIIEDLQNKIFKALRHGEEWKDLIGDNLTMALIDKIEELEEKLKGDNNSDFEDYHYSFADSKFQD